MCLTFKLLIRYDDQKYFWLIFILLKKHEFQIANFIVILRTANEYQIKWKIILNKNNIYQVT